MFIVIMKVFAVTRNEKFSPKLLWNLFYGYRPTTRINYEFFIMFQFKQMKPTKDKFPLMRPKIIVTFVTYKKF